MARLDAEAQAAVVRSSRLPTAAEAREYLESLPELWAKTSDAGRKEIAKAVFEWIDVLGARDYTFRLTAAAKERRGGSVIHMEVVQPSVLFWKSDQFSIWSTDRRKRPGAGPGLVGV